MKTNFNLIEMAKAMKEHKLRHMWRYAAMMALLLTLACGQMWGGTYSETHNGSSAGELYLTTIATSSGTITYHSNSSALNVAQNTSASFTISSTDGSKISRVVFVQNSSYPINTLTSSDGEFSTSSDTYTFTPSTQKTSYSFTLSAQEKKNCRVTTVAVTLTSDCEYFTRNFSISSGTVSCTKSNASSDVTITTNGSVNSNNLSLGNGKTLTISSSGHNITKIYFSRSFSASASTGSFSSNTWTGSAGSVTFTASGSNTISGISVELAASSTYYYRGADNSWGATGMTASAGGQYEYIATTTNNHQFKISTAPDTYAYNKDYVDAGFYSTSISTIGDFGGDNCYIWSAPASYYIIVFKPNTCINSTNNPKICASATLPTDTYSMTYNANGGSGNVPVDNNSYDCGDDVTVLGNVGTPSVLTKAGYSFNGWSTAAGSGDNYSAGGTYEDISANTTLYARWTREAPTAVNVTGSWAYFPGQTITFTAGTTGGTSGFTYQWQKYTGSSYTDIDGATSPTYTKSNCTTSDAGSYRCKVSKAGLDVYSDAGGNAHNVKIYTLNGSYDPEDDWEANNITYSGSGTSGTVTLSLDANETYYFKVTDNYVASQNYYGSGSGNYIVQPINWDCGTNNSNCRLFTGPAGTYTFTVDIAHVGDNSPYVNVQVAYPSVTHPAEGYVYVPKWWSCYPHWWDGSSNPLTPDGYDPQITTYTTICGDDYWYFPILEGYPNLAVKDNATWASAGNNSGSQTTAEHSGMLLTHSGSWGWQSFVSYSITFAANGGSNSMSAINGICPSSDQALTANAYAKTGYNFGGWKTNTALSYVPYGGGDAVNVAVNGIVPDKATIKSVGANITLTAQWTAETYDVETSLTNVTVSSGTTGDDAATYGTAYSVTLAGATGYNLPATVTVTIGGESATLTTDYTYNSSTGALTVLAAKVTGDISISATGVAKTYSITLDDNEGSADGEATATYNSTSLSSLSAPTYTGHVVDGYYTSANCTTKVATGAGALQASITVDEVAWTNSSSQWIKDGTAKFYAHWKCNTPTITDNGDNTVSITVPSGTTVYYTTDESTPSSSNGTEYTDAFDIDEDVTVKAIAIQDDCTDSEVASVDCKYVASCPSANSGAIVYKFAVKSNVSDGNICTTQNTAVELNTTTHLTTLTGGTLEGLVTSSSMNNLAFSSGRITYANGSAGVLILTLDCAVKTGDIIRFVNYSSSNSKYNYLRHTSNSTTTNQITLNASTTAGTVQEIVVPSAFNNKDVLYIVSGSNTTGISSFEIIRPYVVTLDANTNGGKVGGENSATIYAGQSDPQVLPHATKTGYMHTGWFAASSGGSAVSNPYTATSTTTLYAQFSDCPSDGTVYKFQMKSGLDNGNVGITSETDVNVGTYASILEGGTLKAYASNVAYLKVANNNSFSFENNSTYLKVDLDCALAAGDIIKSTTANKKFVVNKTTGTSGAIDITLGTNQETAIPAAWVGEKTLYIYRSGSNTPSPTISYFEIYRPEGYEVTYDKNGHGTAPDSETANTVTLADITVDGWKNTGWTADVDVKVSGSTIEAGTAIDCGTTVTILEATTFTAQWVQTYLLTYDDGDGSGAPDAVYLAAGSTTLSSTIPTYTSHRFLGWNTESDGSGTRYAAGASFTMPSAATTLHAEWQEEATLTWTLTTGTSESSVSTSEKNSTNGTRISKSNMSNLLNNGLTITNNSKSDYTVKIEAPATKNNDKYMYVTFVVADNYELVPSAVTATFQPVDAAASADMILSDTKGHSISLTGASCSKGSANEKTITNGSGVAFSGTVTLKLYCYGSSVNTYRLGPTISIAGDVNYVCPERSTITSPTSAQAIKLYTDRTKTLSIEAEAYAGTLNYQWQKDGADIDGATSASYTVDGSDLTAGTTYAYTCNVSETEPASCATVTSPAFNITAASPDCGWNVIIGVTRTSGASTEGSHEGVLYGSSAINTYNDGKIGGENYYFGLTLKSGYYFQDGDKLYVNLSKVSSNGALTITAGLDGTGDVIGTLSDQTADYNNEITLSDVPDNTSSIVLYRTSTYTQNPYIDGMKVKRYTCPDIYVYDDASGDGLWSEEDNWIGAGGHGSGLPTLEDRVYIQKPITVDIAHATAAEVILDQEDTNSGSLEIQANKGLEVAGKVQVWDGSALSATTASDLYIGSGAAGNGTLIFENDGNAATVAMYSKANIASESTWNWQYIGSPFTSSSALYNYYGSYMYKWNDGWQDVANGANVEPWVGYSITNETANTTYVMEGTLVPTATKELSVPAKPSTVFANSWTAPIYIPAMASGFASGTEQTVYLFNTGYSPDGTSMATSGTEEARYAAGTYLAVPCSTAVSIETPFIAPMQGFVVKNTTSPRAAINLTLNYNTMVRPTTDRSVVGGAMHAPRRGAAVAIDEPEVLKLTVSGTNYDDVLYMLEHESFTTGFDNGWDGTKMGSNAVAPRMYTKREDGVKEAVSAVPDLEGKVINFRAGEDDTYTFYFQYNGDAEALYLYDMNTQAYTRVLTGNTYTFSTEDKAEHDRFIITRYAPQSPTGIEEISGRDATVRKLMIDGKLYIIRGGRMYDATGAMVK